MRKVILVIECTFLAISLTYGICLAKYSGGTGEPNAPYLIATPNDLNSIGLDPNDWNKHFLMTADINMARITGDQFNVIGNSSGPFTGVFDGNYHTIHHFTYEANDTNYVGLFGYCRDAELTNLGFIDPNVSSPTGNHIAVLAGRLEDNVTVSNCFTQAGNVQGRDNVGALAGSTGWSQFADCNCTTDVTGRNYVGGLVGTTTCSWSNKWNSVTNCHVDCNITGSGQVGGLAGKIDEVKISSCSGGGLVCGDTYVGGIVGRSLDYSDELSDSFSTSSIQATGNYVGGLAGAFTGTISDCSASCEVISSGEYAGVLAGYGWTIRTCFTDGIVTGNQTVGGLAGYSKYIENSYSMSMVDGNNTVGGLVGNSITSIKRCYASGSVTCSGPVVAGLVAGGDPDVVFSFWDVNTTGQNNSNGGTPATTAEMWTADTFITWECPGVWTIDEGNDYPRLIWQSLPGTPIEPNYWPGDGTEESPYLIDSAEKLNIIGLAECHCDKHFKLVADINLADYDGLDGRPKFNLIAHWDSSPFTGVFDGNDHLIQNLYHEAPPSGNGCCVLGFIRFTASPALIKNVRLKNVQILAQNGYNYGALVGLMWGGTVQNCFAENVNIVGDEKVGGLIGMGTNIIRCGCTGQVQGTQSVGGLVGRASSDVIESFADCNVAGDEYVGGLVGYYYSSSGKIANCYSNSTVFGGTYAGGLVGLFERAAILNSYASGPVTGSDYVGGLVGYAYSPFNFNSDFVLSCFWDTQSSGIDVSDRGIGKTTAQMKDPNTYLGWGCNNAWTINPGVDYPRLWWENKPGDFITDPPYAGGDGTSADPYLIETEEQFHLLGLHWCDWESNFELANDVNFSTYEPNQIKQIGHRVIPFDGRFDGNDKTISNLTILQEPDEASTGIFGCLRDPCAIIRNLNLSSVTVESTTNTTGSLVGELGEGTIENCHAYNCSVFGENAVGGLVGRSRFGRLSRCSFSGIVSGERDVGGLFGTCDASQIEYCFAKATTIGTSNSNYIGGLAGHIFPESLLHDCYAEGLVKADEYCGGLVGAADASTIQNCYAAAGVISTETLGGGLIGRDYHEDTTVISSFWDTEVSGQTNSEGGIGLTTEQMKTQITFTSAGWDFSTPVWTIKEMLDYPRLWCEPNELPKYAGGTGTALDPFLIDSAEQMQAIGKNPGEWYKHFRLTSDIDLSNYDGMDGREPFNSIGKGYGKSYNDILIPFSGIFDGDDHVISNFIYAAQVQPQVGLFSIVCGSQSEIRNLGLLDPNVTGTGMTGSLVGYLEYATVKECFVESGLVNVSDDHYYDYIATGGLVGYSLGGTISDSYFSGSVDGGPYGYGIGGLLGFNRYGAVYRCFADANVTGHYELGGLVGISEGSISDSYAISDVNGYASAGGLVGSCMSKYYPSTISNCYATGPVGAEHDAGGLVGRDGPYGMICQSSFWNVTLNPNLKGVGSSTGDDPCGVIGRTTEQMQQRSTYEDFDWDFLGETQNGYEDIWRMCQDGVDYPRLSWEFTSYGDLTCPDGVDFIDYSVLADQWLLEKLDADMTNDGRVNLRDFAAWANQWQGDYSLLEDITQNWLARSATIADIAPVGGDDFVDWLDLAILVDNWLQ